MSFVRQLSSCSVMGHLHVNLQSTWCWWNHFHTGYIALSSLATGRPTSCQLCPQFVMTPCFSIFICPCSVHMSIKIFLAAVMWYRWLTSADLLGFHGQCPWTMDIGQSCLFETCPPNVRKGKRGSHLAEKQEGISLKKRSGRHSWRLYGHCSHSSSSHIIWQIALLCLLYWYVDIAGSGNPLYVADFCN